MMSLYFLGSAFFSVALAKLGGGQTTFSYGSNNTNVDCEEACASLTTILGPSKIYHGTLPDIPTEYYSARQRIAVPACLAIPTSAQDVSEIMKVISSHSCTFAAKSGGHSMFAGAASAPGGITIDLKLLNGIELADDKKTLSVGTGNRWASVYGVLEPYNLTVVGGRAGFVGVGGFLLGGGISYVSRRYGWGADNVRNFELVLSNGSISQINYKTHPDLYWALRGGGSNFGLVTRFDLETHPQGLIWGDFNAQFVSDISHRATNLNILRNPVPALLDTLRIKALSSLASVACMIGFCTSLDNYSEQLWRTLTGTKDNPFLQVYGYLCLTSFGDLAGFHMIDGKGDSEDEESYREARGGRKLVSAGRLGGLAWHADELTKNSDNSGARAGYATLSLKNPSEKMIKTLNEMFLEEFGPLRGITGIVLSLPLMFISKDEVLHMTKNGGNPLGLKVEDCPLLLVNAAAGWHTADLDERILGGQMRFIERVRQFAKDNGAFHPYIYMNYASERQDVFAGYGDENRRKLREIQKKYDENDVFRRFQAGYFKV